MLDLGTGSGVNGIVAAARSSDVVAVDVNPSAVECARKNAELNGVGSRCGVRESDLFENVTGRFDLSSSIPRSDGSAHGISTNEAPPTRTTKP